MFYKLSFNRFAKLLNLAVLARSLGHISFVIANKKCQHAVLRDYIQLCLSHFTAKLIPIQRFVGFHLDTNHSTANPEIRVSPIFTTFFTLRICHSLNMQQNGFKRIFT